MREQMGQPGYAPRQAGRYSGPPGGGRGFMGPPGQPAGQPWMGAPSEPPGGRPFNEYAGDGRHNPSTQADQP